MNIIKIVFMKIELFIIVTKNFLAWPDTRVRPCSRAKRLRTLPGERTCENFGRVLIGVDIGNVVVHVVLFDARIDQQHPQLHQQPHGTNTWFNNILNLA